MRNALLSRPLHTSFSGLCLNLLEPSDAPALHNLISRNIDHLTRHGDYAVLASMSVAALAAELSASDNTLRFAIVLDGALIGRIDLVGVEPPRYSIGYWLCEKATRRGYASAALAALIDFARTGLGARDLYAGVTHGNGPSERLLLRAGFAPAARFETFTRFHLGLGWDRLGPTA